MKYCIHSKNDDASSPLSDLARYIVITNFPILYNNLPRRNNIVKYLVYTI
jgi:hypothetical protein